MSNRRILIATGVYPPDIGGPAQYAKNLAEEWRKSGHLVTVKAFRFERKLPTGFRHLFYFFRILPSVARCDFVVALDAWSAALPAVLAAKIFGRKILIRTGGDFLWESYVERSGKLVLLGDFYEKAPADFNAKERLVFRLTRFLLKNAGKIIFSTDWQRTIFTRAYGIDLSKTALVENFYGRKESDWPARPDDNGHSGRPACRIGGPAREKVFLAAARPLKWKNFSRLREAFALAKEKLGESGADLVLDLEPVSREEFMKKMADCYAVILVSLGDISPNTIMDALRFNRPFILTRETGIYERIKDAAVFADPESVGDIAEKIAWLARPENYEAQKEKVRRFSFAHSWNEIAAEIFKIAESL